MLVILTLESTEIQRNWTQVFNCLTDAECSGYVFDCCWPVLFPLKVPCQFNTGHRNMGWSPWIYVIYFRLHFCHLFWYCFCHLFQSSILMLFIIYFVIHFFTLFCHLFGCYSASNRESERFREMNFYVPVRFFVLWAGVRFFIIN